MTDTPGNNIPPIIEREPPPVRQVARWRWWIHLLILAAYPVVIGGVAYFGPERAEPALTGTVKGLLLVSGLELMVFGALFAIAWLASRASKMQLLLSNSLRLVDVPLSVLYSIGLRLGVGIAGAIIAAVLVISGTISLDQVEEFVASNRPDVESLVDVHALETDRWYMLLNLTVVSFIVAGLREEVWRAGVLAGLRELWPNRFSSLSGQLAGVALAAVLFGIGHVSQGALAMFLTGALGVMLGAIMVFHKSIWPAVLAHGVFNATSFVLLPWAMKHLPDL